ncbi:MAG: Dabb family protein [Phototrophicaceae bacterium]
MIRRVVMFKFHESTIAADRQQLVDMLHRLSEIDVVRHIEVGKNFTESPMSYDLVFMVDLDNEIALKHYHEHPTHMPVLGRAAELCSAAHVVDYLVAIK